MKKVLAFAAAALLCLPAIFAENTVHFGMNFPISKATVDVDGNDAKANSTGFDVWADFTHVSENGFTWKAGLGVGSSSNDDIFEEDIDSIDFDLSAGFGYSFIHDEKMTLSLTGNLGLFAQGYELEKDYGVISTEWKYSPLVFYIGPEVSFTYRFTEHFGAFANFGIFYQVGNTEYTIEMTGAEKYKYNETFDLSGFLFEPKIGLSWTF